MTSWLCLNTSPISMSLTCSLLLVQSTCISTSVSAQGEYIFGLLLPHGSPLHCPPLNSQRDLYKIRSYPFHAQISSMALTALQDLALAHLSGFVPHQSASHSWAQPRWLFMAFCWSMMVLSLCLGIFAPVPLLRTLFPQLFGLPCSLTSFGAYLAPRYLVMEDFPDRYPQLVPLRSSLHHAARCLLLYDT